MRYHTKLKNKRLAGWQIVENNDPDYLLMKKYYTLAISAGNVYALYRCGKYYLHVSKNKDIAKKFFIRGAKEGHIRSMIEAGKLSTDTTEANTYFGMAIEKEAEMHCIGQRDIIQMLEMEF